MSTAWRITCWSLPRARRLSRERPHRAMVTAPAHSRARTTQRPQPAATPAAASALNHLMPRSAAFTAHHPRPVETQRSVAVGFLVQSRTHKYPIFARLRAWRIVTRVQAPASAGRSAFRAFLSFLVRALQPELACLYGDGLGSLGDARLQCTGGRVPGDSDPVLAQVPDHLGWAYRARYVGSGAGPA